MTKPPPSFDKDPPRWIERPLGRGPEDHAGERLRGARPLALPALSVRAARGAWARPRRFRGALAFATIVIGIGIGVGVAGASGVWLTRVWKERVRAEDRVEVPRGSLVRLRRPGRWRAALTGPAVAVVGDGVRLEAGALTMEADEASASAEVGGKHFSLEPGAVARFALSPAGGAEVVAVDGQIQAFGASTRRATERERSQAWHALDDTRSDPDAVSASPASSAQPAPPEVVTRAPGRAVDRSEPTVVARAPAGARSDAASTVDEPSEVVPAPVAAPALAGTSDSEAALLAAALTKLRREGDTGAALALLDRDLARHPDGALVPEVMAVQIEAWLARGEDAKALEVLDGLPRSRAPLDRRLRALRGELRAKAGRCVEATVDFSETLRAPPSDAVDERILRGRAACAALAHDDAALRADLDLYVRRFPGRPFAREARRRLETP